MWGKGWERVWGKQGWKFAHLLITHLLIHSFRSNQMSDCERFTQMAQDKWATMSESLRSLTKNEWMSVHSIIFGLKYLKSYILVCFTYIFYLKNEWFAHSLFLMKDVSKSLRLLTKNEWCEQIAHVAHHKWATMSKSLRSLTKSERMRESLFFKKCVIHSENRWANFQPWVKKGR